MGWGRGGKKFGGYGGGGYKKSGYGGSGYGYKKSGGGYGSYGACYHCGQTAERCRRCCLLVGRRCLLVDRTRARRIDRAAGWDDPGAGGTDAHEPRGGQGAARRGAEAMD